MFGLIVFIVFMIFAFHFGERGFKLIEEYLAMKKKYEEDILKLIITSDKAFTEMLEKNWVPWAKSKGIVK